MVITSKATPLSKNQWEMIKLLTRTNFTRSEMISFLGVSRGTFYRWLRDLRVRKILQDIEKANLNVISTELQKRWQEKIRRISSYKRGVGFKPREDFEDSKVSQEPIEEDFGPEREAPLRVQDLPQEIRDNLPTKLKPGGNPNLATPDMWEPDWPKIKEMLVDYERKNQDKIRGELKDIEKEQDQKIADEVGSK